MYILSAEERMEKVIDRYVEELSKVRTGRANAAILDSVMLDYYGTMTPLNQVGSISVVEGKQLVIKPYDNSFLKEIEKAININDIGLTPQNDGTVIRLNVPALTEEVRKTIVKGLGKTAEDAKIQIRNIRRDVNEEIKKDKEVAEDEEKKYLLEIQKTTDSFIKKIDELTDKKSKEVMTI